MRWPVPVACVFAACSARAVPQAPAPVAPPPAPPAAALPALTLGGLGPLTGDVVSERDAVAAALPALAWTERYGRGGLRIIGALDGRPAVVVRGERFVSRITVMSPHLASAVGVAVGDPAAGVRPRFPACTNTADPFGEPAVALLDCEASDGVGIEIEGHLRTDPNASLGDAGVADDHVLAVAVRVHAVAQTAAQLVRTVPALADDPVVAASALIVAPEAIHPITDLPRVDAAALARALPQLDIAATATGFAIAHAGTAVAEVTVADGKPTRVTVFHPSVRHDDLAIAIGQPLAHADAATEAQLRDTACATAADKHTATCGLVRLPRLALALAANVGMPRAFELDSDYGDVRVTSIAWTPPRVPSAWPTIDDDGVGPLSSAIITNMDVLRARELLLPDFDVIGPVIGPISTGPAAVIAYVDGAEVLELDEGGTVVVYDPRVVIAGTRIGPGSTIGDARAAGLEMMCAAEPDGPDLCWPRRHLALRLHDGGGGNAKRRIESILWDDSL